jgi:hypothetical protein
MLDEQSNLNGPYDPNPFNDPDLEKTLNTTDLTKQHAHEVNGTRGSLSKLKSRKSQVQAIILNKGYIPLILRLISWMFSIAALILAAKITRDSVKGGLSTRPSTILALVVNAVAIFYLPWVAKVFFFEMKLMVG